MTTFSEGPLISYNMFLSQFTYSEKSKKYLANVTKELEVLNIADPNFEPIEKPASKAYLKFQGLS